MTPKAAVVDHRAERWLLVRTRITKVRRYSVHGTLSRQEEERQTRIALNTAPPRS
jgi:hypothetical protein